LYFYPNIARSSLFTTSVACHSVSAVFIIEHYVASSHINTFKECFGRHISILFSHTITQLQDWFTVAMTVEVSIILLGCVTFESLCSFKTYLWHEYLCIIFNDHHYSSVTTASRTALGPPSLLR